MVITEAEAAHKAALLMKRLGNVPHIVRVQADWHPNVDVPHDALFVFVSQKVPEHTECVPSSFEGLDVFVRQAL